MMKITAILNEQDGSVIVAAMLILVLLTIIGISATSISNTELNISSNTQLHKIAFFSAESGWNVTVDWLDDQYPLPTVPLGSENVGPTDGLDNDGDSTTDEADEFAVSFETDKFDDPEAIALSDFYKSGYESNALYTGAAYAPGWGVGAMRYQYLVTSVGQAPARKGTAVSRITVTAGKIQEQ